ncbi:MAG: arginine--tRNA ligase domain-containing protein [Candidatus Kariarchaeaceae archaeon]
MEHLYGYRVFEEFQNSVNEVLSQNKYRPITLLQPPNPELGDFCFVINQIAGKEDPQTVAKALQTVMVGIDGIDGTNISTIGSKKKTTVFLNFVLEEGKRAKIYAERINQVLSKVNQDSYGNLDIFEGKSIIVEHTSANPISPLHVGNLRNSVQGDTFARILKHAGYDVHVHYYVNDVGLQIGFVVVGYEIIKEKGIYPPIKIDLFTGQIYAIMNCFFNIQKLKTAAKNRGVSVKDNYQFIEEELDLIKRPIEKELETVSNEIEALENVEKLEKNQKIRLKEAKMERNKLSDELSDIEKYSETYHDLESRFGDIFAVLKNGVESIDLQVKVTEYLKAYETNSDKETTALFREVVNWVLSAFEWTLHRYNIDFDQFDFESDVTWSGRPNEVIDQLSNSSNSKTDGQAVRYQYPTEAMQSFMKEVGWTKKDLPIRGQVPDLQLRRSDGTALYAAKDIAYSLVKFEDKQPERIYNVISMEQSLPQFQMLLPLHELGYTNFAVNLRHYAYDNVDLRGRTMSGRLAKYITADEYYDESYIRARMAKRSADQERGLSLPTTSKEWDEEHQILRAVTLASTRFPLIETNPKKRIELDLDRELDFKRNAGPFVQYAHARTNSLLEKAALEKGWVTGGRIDVNTIANHDTVQILDHLDRIDKQILTAVEDEDPSKISSWVFELAQMFMKFYEKFPVIAANNESTGKARLEIVGAIRKGLALGLGILGITAAERL